MKQDNEFGHLSCSLALLLLEHEIVGCYEGCLCAFSRQSRAIFATRSLSKPSITEQMVHDLGHWPISFNDRLSIWHLLGPIILEMSVQLIGLPPLLSCLKGFSPSQVFNKGCTSKTQWARSRSLLITHAPYRAPHLQKYQINTTLTPFKASKLGTMSRSNIWTSLSKESKAFWPELTLTYRGGIWIARHVAITIQVPCHTFEVPQPV